MGPLHVARQPWWSSPSSPRSTYCSAIIWMLLFNLPEHMVSLAPAFTVLALAPGGSPSPQWCWVSLQPCWVSTQCPHWTHIRPCEAPARCAQEQLCLMVFLNLILYRGIQQIQETRPKDSLTTSSKAPSLSNPQPVSQTRLRVSSSSLCCRKQTGWEAASRTQRGGLQTSIRQWAQRKTNPKFRALIHSFS